MAERLIVGISGASGVIYGIRLLQTLRERTDIETHLVMSTTAQQTIAHETDWTVKAVEEVAHKVYDNRDIAAPLASGSFTTRGMVILPCSIKTLSGVANSYNADLMTRAADVTLKEGRPLVLAVRETPLHLGHLRLMERAAETGAVIFPPMPEFYSRPHTLDDLITQTVGRILTRLDIDNTLFTPWPGLAPKTHVPVPGESPAPTLQERLRAYLAAQTTLTLATVNDEGVPHACDLFYAQADDWTLYFLSSPDTDHARQLARPRVAATIHGPVHGWTEIRGVQLDGQAARVTDAAERARGLELYLTKFPFVRQWLAAPETLGVAREPFGLIELYMLKPHRLRYIDNMQGFGHKEELVLSKGPADLPEV